MQFLTVRVSSWLESIVLAGDDALPRISPHGLRHTAEPLALMKDASLEAVSDMLGHKDSSITRQTHIHITEKFRRENVLDLFPSVPSRAVRATAVN